MKKLNEREIVEKLKESLNKEPISKREFIEVPLTSLGLLLWPNSDFNELKYRNRVLAQALRSKRFRIIRKHGKRYVLIPKDFLQERKRMHVEPVWRW